MRRRTSAHTETCKRLVKEWSFYVSKAKCLSKVFVSIKGVYFQAEVGGWMAFAFSLLPLYLSAGHPPPSPDS